MTRKPMKPVKLWALVDDDGNIHRSFSRNLILTTRNAARANRESTERIVYVLVAPVPRKRVKK